VISRDPVPSIPIEKMPPSQSPPRQSWKKIVRPSGVKRGKKSNAPSRGVET
jgi:hypothetical protein